MVDNLKIDDLNIVLGSPAKANTSSSAFQSQQDVSIFNSFIENNAETLHDKLDYVDANNGAIKETWNDLKEKTGLGMSIDKCEEAIKKYENGELSFEEASDMIDEYGAKQDSSLNLFSNIITSIAAIAAVAAVTVGTAGIGTLGAIALGSGVGALTKAGFKLADRATNEIDGDAKNVKQIAKDALSGAITGGLATYSMGTAASAKTLGQAFKGCGRTGTITGSVSGSANYLIDTSFDENKEFKIKDLATSTLQNAAVGTTVGVIMGGFNFGLHSHGILNSGCSLNNMIDKSVNGANLSNVTANSVCTAEYKILTDRIKDIAA